MKRIYFKNGRFMKISEDGLKSIIDVMEHKPNTTHHVFMIRGKIKYVVNVQEISFIK